MKLYTLNHFVGLLICIVIISQCSSPPNNGPMSTYEADNPSSTLVATETKEIRPPDINESCTGWSCTLVGTVYEGTKSKGNELSGISVNLSQFSYCSPTSGDHETITDKFGEFRFEVYLHDTDSLTFHFNGDVHGQADYILNGFDCLFCSCVHLSIILNPGSG